MPDKINMDKAGNEYWNQSWIEHALPDPWDVNRIHIRNYVERNVFSYIRDVCKKYGYGPGTLIVEVGCARSQVLPVIATELGFRVSGIDYSEPGCDQARMILKRAGIEGDIHCADLFQIPDSLQEKYDVVISFGLIEHFTDTKSVVYALSRLLKPGGLVITNLPNMYGMNGFVQKVLNREIYEVHIPLTPEDVNTAHVESGLNVVDCSYFLTSNFGVVNIGSPNTRSPIWWIKKITLALLARLSMLAWMVQNLNLRLPTSKLMSPYINCSAIKPVRSS